ncbi:hypothetical protein SAMN02745181_2724 [Rubritalea squalenifaciens DSM 18772]|uniref:Uncharacterized protein n=2 Tax=Rubritalea squalenifaciens TaxID=407226 RepID=A0A1M6MGD2_9BACT|nr:hypothetical protein SAMN02745181_2724 [Rubritalea squalenifaciens DSM 18772]
MVGVIGYKPFLMRLLQTLPFSLGAAILLLSSCASERKVSYTRGESSGISKYESDVRYQQQADGSVRPNKDVRSQYDGRQEYLSARSFGGQDYTTEKYGKKRWGRNTDYANKQYGGKTDGSHFQYSPEFVQQQAMAQGQLARVNGQNYGANQYAAGQANVQNRNHYLAKPANAKTESRRGVYKQPDIISKQDFTELSIEESKSLLGRDR